MFTFNKICLKSANQIKARDRLKCFYGNEERKVLMNSFVLSNLSFWPLVWMFYVKWLWKFQQGLTEKVWKNKYESRRTRTLLLEIYKTIYSLKLEFIKNLFKVCKTNWVQRKKYKLHLEIRKFFQVSFGTKNLRLQDQKVWNSLSFQIKSTEKL